MKKMATLWLFPLFLVSQAFADEGSFTDIWEATKEKVSAAVANCSVTKQHCLQSYEFKLTQNEEGKVLSVVLIYLDKNQFHTVEVSQKKFKVADQDSQDQVVY